MEYKISTALLLDLAKKDEIIKQILKKEYPLVFLDSGYYYINGTAKVLYWDGEKWLNGVKDSLKMYSLISALEKQPKNIKTVEKYRTMFD